MSSVFSRAVLIHNSRAGRGHRQRLTQIEAAIAEFERSGIQVTRTETQAGGDAERLARQAVENGADLIIACGGDGTINEVACGMIHSRVPLAILPGGTANVLARELGLPLSISGASRHIVAGVPRRLAMGRAGSRPFLLMAGVGFDAHVVSKVSTRWKRWFGMGTYIFEAIRQAIISSPPPFVLSDGTREWRVTFACVSKTQHYGPIRIVEEANLFEDKLFVYGFHSENRLRYFVYALAVITGRTHKLRDVSRFEASRLRCVPAAEQANPILLQTDGELAGSIPCTIDVVPDAITLLVPSRLSEAGMRAA